MGKRHRSPFVIFVIFVIFLLIGSFCLFVSFGFKACISGEVQVGMKISDEDRMDIDTYLQGKYHKSFTQTRERDSKTEDCVDNNSGHSVFEHVKVNCVDENGLNFRVSKEFNNSWKSNYQDETTFSDTYEIMLYQFELWALLKNNGYYNNEYNIEPNYSGSEINFIMNVDFSQTVLYGSLTNFVNNFNNDLVIRIYAPDVDVARDKEMLGKIVETYPDLKPVHVECTFKDDVKESFIVGNSKVVRS